MRQESDGQLRRNLVRGLLVVASVFAALAASELVFRGYVFLRGGSGPSVVSGPFDAGLAELAKTVSGGTDAFNIYYFGGSAMVGEPFDPEMGIPQFIHSRFRGHIDGSPIRTLMVAQKGRDLEFNLNSLKQVVTNRSLFKPKLLVFYTGHNEFMRFHSGLGFTLKRSGELERLVKRSIVADSLARLKSRYALEVDDRRLMDNLVTDPESFDLVLAKFKKMVLEVRDIAEREQIPILFATEVGNYADWDPNRSVYRGPPNLRKVFEAGLLKAIEAQGAGRDSEAIKLFEGLLRVDPRFAECHYRLGVLYDRKSAHSSAAEHFMLASDNDGMPIRASSEMLKFPGSLTGRKYFMPVDVLELFRSRCRPRQVGAESFMDAHHPNLEGYALVARAFSEKIASHFNFSVPEHMGYERERLLLESFGLRRDRLTEIHRSRAWWAMRLASWRFDSRFRINLAHSHFQRAIEFEAAPHADSQAKIELLLGRAVGLYLLKEAAEADLLLQQAEVLGAELVKGYLSISWISDVIERGRSYRAQGGGGG